MPRIIVIDPGHGGTTTVGGSSPNNATGPTGLLEKAVILDVALRVKRHLALLPYRVIMTRDTDRNVGINARAKVARDNNAELFVSIHFNGNANATVQGTEAWIGANTPDDCDLLARSILQRLVHANGLRDRGVKVDTNDAYGVIRLDNHLVTTAHTLVEVSFLTDPVEEARLKTSAYLDLIAGAVAIGIDDFMRRSSGSSTPLHYAIRSRDMKTIGALLKAGANVDLRDENGMTPLMVAAQLGLVDATTKLIDAGAKVDARRGVAPLGAKVAKASKARATKRQAREGRATKLRTRSAGRSSESASARRRT
jgi:N-acetylmuramoyl-L-alanine amidase